MYNVKGPSKIVAKTTRRGVSQNMDYSRTKSVDNDESISVPKPVFYTKRATSDQHRQEIISPQHEEIINFVNDSWNKVCAEMDSSSSKTKRFYYEDGPFLEDFKPFDLESWWGKRLYECMTGNNKN